MKAIRYILCVVVGMMLLIGVDSCDNKKKVSDKSSSESESKEKIKSDSTKSDNSEKIVLIDFYATWCGPCKAMVPVMEQMEDMYGEWVEFKRVDIDKEPELAEKYNVDVIPTLVFLTPDEEVIDIIQGYHDVNQMDEIMNKILK
ncbi:MAG: thioredoxin family protein [Muribaculaceae bacterium]|nr:thioredoxin family protein [Muribaculaceae bacterium]